jgi:hypothetical protein
VPERQTVFATGIRRQRISEQQADRADRQRADDGRMRPIHPYDEDCRHCPRNRADQRTAQQHQSELRRHLLAEVERAVSAEREEAAGAERQYAAEAVAELQRQRDVEKRQHLRRDEHGVAA